MRYTIILVACITILSCNNKKAEDLPQNPVIAASDTGIVSTDTEFDSLIGEFEAPTREQWQQPDFIIKFLGPLKGKKVADIGAGTGYFSFRIAEQADTVYAIDIEQKFLNYIEEQKYSLSDGKGQNVVTLLTAPDKPGIIPGKTDAVILVNTYHLINNRTNYFRKLYKDLKAGGLLLIVDFKQGEKTIGPASALTVDASTVLKELNTTGFKIDKIDTTSLVYQYILRFNK
jgi:ubiquinone/menaquinone biosynthesis C-methylase UbiE